MADLSNLKIKNTYQNVLQLDSGALQNLLGQTPSLFEVNGNLRYIDGNQQDGYVLKSNAVGDAIWGSVSTGDLYVSAATLDNTILKLHTTSGNTISVPVSYWSTDGNGNYANSGLTGNIGIGTTTPNEKLTVVGAISATTDLYLGSSTHSASTIAAQEQLTIKGRGVDNDMMILSQDDVTFYLDGSQYATMTSSSHPSVGAGVQWNASGQEYGFTILGGDATSIFRVYGDNGENRIRIKNHLTIGANNAISHTDSSEVGVSCFRFFIILFWWNIDPIKRNNSSW